MHQQQCCMHTVRSTNPSRFPQYEPELFPGLIYHMVRPKVVLLIFVSGKVVLTGALVYKQCQQQRITYQRGRCQEA